MNKYRAESEHDCHEAASGGKDINNGGDLACQDLLSVVHLDIHANVRIFISYLIVHELRDNIVDSRLNEVIVDLTSHEFIFIVLC